MYRAAPDDQPQLKRIKAVSIKENSADTDQTGGRFVPISLRYRGVGARGGGVGSRGTTLVVVASRRGVDTRAIRTRAIRTRAGGRVVVRALCSGLGFLGKWTVIT